ncbi:hypothetical protein TorRG33x02_352900 [Trema orientale]|uniref:Uncharacterized protein n=1 Tax=Trema orientale TaxID=63057 RepID=A0A2P5ADM2_TREOI|nr:hypothetical protein TorRG33x02_352900 [Trema orientale]
MDGGARSSKSNPQSHMSSTRGVRGPMDRFIVSLDDDDEDVRNKASPIQRNSKEMWNQNEEEALLVNELSSDDEWLVGEYDGEDLSRTVDEDLNFDVFGEGDQSRGSQKKSTPETSKAAGKRKKLVTNVNVDEEEWEDLDSDDEGDDRAIRYDDSSEDPLSHDDLEDD